MADQQDARTRRGTKPYRTAEFREEAGVRELGRPYCQWRDASDRLHHHSLDAGAAPVSVGRRATQDIALPDDRLASGLHARLHCAGGIWTIEDVGSRNGTFVDGVLLARERRLRDGVQIRIGETAIAFHDPSSDSLTAILAPEQTRLAPNQTQRLILIELARPFVESAGDVPSVPSNAAIAALLGYEQSTVRDAISDLYKQAGISGRDGDARARLAQMAMLERVVTSVDFARARGS